MVNIDPDNVRADHEHAGREGIDQAEPFLCLRALLIFDIRNSVHQFLRSGQLGINLIHYTSSSGFCLYSIQVLLRIRTVYLI